MLEQRSSGDVTDAGAEVLPQPSISGDPLEPLREASMLDAPPRPGVAAVLDRFEVVRALGAGGMGVVVLARSGSGAMAAIKLLRPELAGSAAAVQRFLREARHMQKLEHPGVVPVLEISDRSGSPYFVMPYLDKGSLADLIGPSRKPLDPGRASAVARQLAQTLAFAHARGITHRDIKPANVLIDSESRPRLADFGLGRTVFNDASLDLVQPRTEGTPAYMAPEIAAGRAGDTRCDIYSFGATLYEMLTGHRPYDGSPQEVLEQLRNGPPRPIRERCPSAPEPLANIAEWAMARELRNRYAEMDDIVADLERVGRGEKPLGPAGSPAGKSRRRWRWGIAAALAVTSAVVVAWLLQPRFQPAFEVPIPAGSIAHFSALLGDHDGDGAKDLFLSQQDDFLVLAITRHGERLAASSLRSPDRHSIHMGLVQDADGDGRDELFADWISGTDLVIAMLNQNLVVTREFRAPGPVGDGHGVTAGTRLGAVRLVDLDGDGRRELLAIADSDGDILKPRGLRCFDLETAALKWSCETAASPSTLATADLDGDGRLEIILGSHANGNGNTLADSTSDAECRLYAIRSDGSQLWSKLMGHWLCHTYPIVANVNGNGKTELFAWTFAQGYLRKGLPNPDVGFIVRLDGRGNQVARYDAGAPMASCVVGDDGGVYAADCAGYVHALDKDLRLLRKSRLLTPPGADCAAQIALAAAADLDGDGRITLVFTCHIARRIGEHNGGTELGPRNITRIEGMRLVLLDENLQIKQEYPIADLWKADFNPRLFVGRITSDRPETLLLADKVLLFRPGR